MLYQVDDDALVELRQLGEELQQPPPPQLQVWAAERAEEPAVQLVGEERLGQLAQVELQETRHRVDVHFFDQLLRLVDVCRRVLCVMARV